MSEFSHLKNKLLAEQVEDALGAAELAACRGVLEKMPFADRACGFFCDRAALAAWPAFDALQLRLDTLPVYGSLEELLLNLRYGNFSGIFKAMGRRWRKMLGSDKHV